METSKNTAKAEKKPVQAKAKLKNLTGQKQVIAIAEKSFTLNAYETIEVEFTKGVAANKFKFWVEKNIVTIS